MDCSGLMVPAVNGNRLQGRELCWEVVFYATSMKSKAPILSDGCHMLKVGKHLRQLVNKESYAESRDLYTKIHLYTIWSILCQ